VIEPTADEASAHREYLALLDKEIGGRCIWLAVEKAAEAVPDAA
jgi:hypothetical protein